MLKQSKRQLGFNLVESLVVIVILATLVGIAAPSFGSVLAGLTVRSVADSMLQGLQLARAEAIRRNERVVFVVAADSSWSISTDAGTSIQSKPARDGTLKPTLTITPNDATSATFNAYGRITANANGTGSPTQFDIAVDGTSVSRRITIASGGQLHICDPAVTTNGDPRKC
ncbi:type IV fimbrial biogenesis protein FimT [Noviherbaspirillum humi]|uniref:Type II secretion system protein H n=1 Tax=Noviherbaspirillum humi TaxID=1688639 RepID=A0A239KNM5_9BURK|nr:GspH/FimT family pseudopilin [Noviherbaspirillum humi]SNT19630.1 type IV fimbrial biogenesis protein FimT [Noviherbaspirillum humi]